MPVFATMLAYPYKTLIFVVAIDLTSSHGTSMPIAATALAYPYETSMPTVVTAPASPHETLMLVTTNIVASPYKALIFALHLSMNHCCMLLPLPMYHNNMLVQLLLHLRIDTSHMFH